MALFPVNIALVSRFQTAKENKETLLKVAEGKIDILVGTHRMIGKDVKFKDLGLVIIDEEQRFGVRAKEKLKAFQVGVDSLSMSATPIPRTLYLSLVGARKLSVINSPPQDRLPIKSLLVEREENLIKNGILRELSRDGQVYFIHNRVESIYKVAEELEKLVPSAKVGVVHGQLESDQIDDVFHAFKHGEINVLVATTIIENGLDIPNANTIFIDRSDTFGISDLYQLRGRVGRWNKTAYAYFMIPKQRQLPEISQKRLNAIIETSGFGGGMKLAMRDLELRGAGDILGVQQSGHVSSIGFHLYCKLLKRAIEALKKEGPTSFIETRLEFSYDAKLSSFYIPDSSLRLEIYHKLGEATTNEEVENIFAELKDRFGKPPESVVWLYHMTRIRIFANQKNYTLLKFLKSTISLEHVSNPPKSFLLPAPKDGASLEAFVTKILS
jgi:transcription-repair coupling factor (superfamily II helicase)